MRTPVISRIDGEDSPESRELVQFLVSFNAKVAPAEDWKSFVLIARDETGALVGGIKGYSHWGWLFISHLWVGDSVRGTGLGTRLLSQAEQIGKEQACQNVWLDTFSFQALGFYKKNGYQEFAQLEDFPPGSTRHFLKKKL